MLIAGIIFSLIFILAISLFLRYRGVRLAYLWLFLVGSAVLIWLILLITQPNKISPWVIEDWIVIGGPPVSLNFQMNNSNWSLSVTYFSLLIAFLLTSVIHLRGSTSLYEWIEMGLLILSGWIVLMAHDYWSILIGWTLIDFVELIFHFRYKALTYKEFYSHFLFKFMGSLLLIFIISRSFQINPTELFAKKFDGIGLLIGLAAMLHSGILINYSEASDQEPSPESTLVFLRIISFVTSFYLLIYAPVPNLAFLLNIVIKILFFTLAVVQMYKWATEKNKFFQIRKFLIAFSAVLCLMFLSGSGNFIELWLILPIIPFGWLLIFTDREKKFQVIVFILGILVSALPYSITFNGLFQLSQQRQWLDMILILIPMILALSGFINHATQKNGDLKAIEPWYQLIYMIGLIIPLFSTIAIITKISYPILNNFGVWWIGLLVSTFSIFMYYFQIKKIGNEEKRNPLQETNAKWISSLKAGIQYLFDKIYFGVEYALLFFSSLFEKNGGILWSIVFLVLFITLLNFQGAAQ
jgi:hypothetical protein